MGYPHSWKRLGSGTKYKLGSLTFFLCDLLLNPAGITRFHSEENGRNVG